MAKGKQKPVTVGIDFDGVLAYNPFRVIRAPVKYAKRHLFGERKTKFYIPSSPMERFIWLILHESSIFPAKGVPLFKDMVKQGMIEPHLVTARYSFLQDRLYTWLRSHDLQDYFKTITVNEKDEQPHLYKARTVAERKFDYFIEDNLDIVTHLNKATPNTKTLWIYNILDRTHPYPTKFPHLKHALEHIRSQL